MRRRALNNGKSNEGGYTLVALIAVMSLLALFAMAAAPDIKQQAQREREKEAIFRGEEVANAIRAYVEYRNSQGARGVAALPTSIDQLLEGIPRGTHKVQILRAEAAVDPLSRKGEWRLIGPTSPDLIQFVQAVTVYAGGSSRRCFVNPLKFFAPLKATTPINFRPDRSTCDAVARSPDWRSQIGRSVQRQGSCMG